MPAYRRALGCASSIASTALANVAAVGKYELATLGIVRMKLQSSTEASGENLTFARFYSNITRPRPAAMLRSSPKPMTFAASI